MGRKWSCTPNAGSSQDQRQAQGEKVDLADQVRAVVEAGLEECLALSGALGRGAQQLGQVEPEPGQHQDRDQ